jgi:CheY-like chemotaxis protein
MNSVMNTADSANFEFDIASQPGVGTTISFFMPYTVSSGTEAEHDRDASSDANHKLLKIAVIDTDASVLDRIVNAVYDPDNSVDTFSSADAFRQRAGQKRYDVFICGIELIGEGGARLADVIQADFRNTQMIVTGQVVPDLKTLDTNWIFVQKPIEIERLAKLIATIKIIRTSHF